MQGCCSPYRIIISVISVKISGSVKPVGLLRAPKVSIYEYVLMFIISTERKNSEL